MRGALLSLLLCLPAAAAADDALVDPPTVFDILGSDRNRRVGKAHISLLGDGAAQVLKGFRAEIEDLKIQWIPISPRNQRRYRRVFPRRDLASDIDPWQRIRAGKGRQARIRALHKQLDRLHAASGIEVLLLGRSQKRVRVVLTEDGDEIPGSTMTDVELVALMLPSGERLFSRSRRLRWPDDPTYDPSADLEALGRGLGKRFRKRLAAYFDEKAGAGEDAP